MKTTYMGMELPQPGQTPAGQWGGRLNEALEDHVDTHDHVPGRGKPIPSDGIKLDKDLPARNQSIVDLKSVAMVPQGSPVSKPGHLWVQGVDLYFTTIQGHQVRLTENGSVVPGLEGNIKGLVAPAEARYSGVERKFTFLTNVSTQIRAILDAGVLYVREMVAGGKRVALRTPSGLANDYDLTLPQQLPSEQLPLFLSPTGHLNAGQVSTEQIEDEAVTTDKIGPGAVETLNIADGAVTKQKLPAQLAYRDEYNEFNHSVRIKGNYNEHDWALEVESEGPAAGFFSTIGTALYASSHNGTGYAAELEGNATKAPLHLFPHEGDLPPNPVVGDICVHGFALWVASKTSPQGTTHWRKLAFEPIGP